MNSLPLLFLLSGMFFILWDILSLIKVVLPQEQNIVIFQELFIMNKCLRNVKQTFNDSLNRKLLG